MTSFARNNILKRIELALKNRTDIPFPEELHTRFSFGDNESDLKARFIHEFTALDGHVVLCREKSELLAKLDQLAAEKNWTRVQCNTPALTEEAQLHTLPFVTSNSGGQEADAGITDCECLVARTGTVVLSAAQASGRVLPVHSPVHVVIALVNDLVFDIGDALVLLKQRYGDDLPSAIFFASGPSRTADIEKRLVLGVHGPREVYLFLIETDLKPQH
jgi:L-lactate dehydrogenase complex protein LldG